MRPKLLSRDITAQNQWTTFVREALEFSSGGRGDYLIVERGPALMVIALVRKDGILHTFLVRQFRYPIGQEIWQFPMGTLNIEEDPAVHAAEEFRQETGAVAQKLTLMGEFFVDPGLSRQKCLVFVAEGVVEGGAQELEETEMGLQSRLISIEMFETMLNSGELNDAWGYAGLFFLKKYLAEQA
ncbi:MAG: NUDIX hydrolase [Chloroflexota bacterium]